MKIVERIADFAEGTLAYLSSSVKQSVADYLDIEYTEDETTFVLKDGSRMTLLRVNGSRRMIGVEEFRDIDGRLTTSLQAFMRGGGHAVSCIFESDPDLVEREVREAQKPMRDTAARIGLNLEDLFEEDVLMLKESCSAERCWVALYTRPSAFTAAELKRDVSARMELLKENPIPSLEDAPNLFRVIAALKSRHDSFVSSFMQELASAEISLVQLEVHEACRDMRMSLDREFTSSEWRASLPGDKIPVREQRRNPADMSGALWPRLDRQLAPRDIHEDSSTSCTVGGLSYKPMYIFMHQSGNETVPFQALFRRVRDTRAPWRVKFQIESGGLNALGFKRMITAIIGFTNPENGLMRAAADRIEHLVREQNELDVKLRVDLTSWAPAGNKKLLEDRTSKLARAVQAWGGTDVRELSGDPVQALVATTPGLSLNSPATVACAVLADVTQMLSFYRPASPWEFGALMFNSPDGKLFPFQPSSSVQSNWINTVIAEPRAGKSVLVNAMNLAFTLSPGLTDLPYIAIIDIGRSSSGFTSLIREAAPEQSKHKVVQFRMRMRAEDSVNPFDTQLGCRRPLPHEEALAVNFTTLLMTPPGESHPADGMPGLCAGVIEYAYKHFADNAQPRRYSPQTEGAEQVDRAILAHGLHVDRNTTWWEVVDQLFARGDIHAASLAQRYAVPTLSDLAAISRERQFADLYGQKLTSSGEPLLTAFARMLSESIRRYPVLSRPTAFDVGDARIVSIDLDEVAKQGSAVADHQTNVCYMLARHAAARNFYLREEHIDSFPPEYKGYHEKRIREIRQNRKHLCFDEVHRTSKAVATQNQIELDAREGGKWGVMLTLISHRPHDFPDAVLSFSTGNFVLSPTDEDAAQLMRDKWQASATVQYAAKKHIRPPTAKDGSTMVAIFKTKSGPCTQLLNLKMGGIRLWAFSTSNEDSYVRDVLYSQIGGQETRRLLAALYPAGTVLPEIERRKLALQNRGVMVDSEKEEGVINELIREIKSKYDAARLKGVAFEGIRDA
ncbi:type IV secretion protein IcmB [Xanthomonas euvesicatoria pv. eucalypti]|uniref:type IV secretion protein IcmB n=1 Tax=Xanthomonas euvesicatoria TaxID=456327 RepID=UPI0026E2CC2E|nr:type IV secretion protein IcmB [Xanthomonas euvesicatoria]MDO7931509.1 type IV secretion protein IcmB [Xanthomonas euvesicatoria pv. eucalypti]MDO7935764.1 type IV secretion protein IcmB [Xanthomonas euvesicatoria pv. eucalypti]MDO7940036.1 type IV secretion protein IcmB [Xanthomonas euvesicatoria pv. eucalypti]MDO7944611.1 type IV secretion protein IcmB [Xanthomonas euvesicatoria pv. eucalypti]MDO7952013.1 type IV secretion protein IcmB [Xanthomonas euvesicatoria pv. eucalypti]